MLTLGIHDGHNASVAMVEDGVVVFALQEERLTNEKNFVGPPLLSIAEALRWIGRSIDEVDSIAIAALQRYGVPPVGAAPVGHPVSRLRAQMSKRVPIQVQRREPYLSLQRRKNIRWLNYLESLGKIDWDRVEFVEHHLCHAATAYYGSPYNKLDDHGDVLVLTADGSGDGTCATVSIGRGGRLERIAETPTGNSVGDIYAGVTGMLGFKPLEHEYKLMGLAPYADPERSETSLEYFRSLLRFDKDNHGLTFTRTTREPTYALKEQMHSALAYQRFDSICLGLQTFTEEILVEWVRTAIRHTGIRRVALSGGVFMNVKANKLISELPEVDALFIMPSCGDESNALGAALEVNHRHNEKTGESSLLNSAIGSLYLGPDLKQDTLNSVIEDASALYDVTTPDDLEIDLARLLAGGEVIAVARGRIEFGARALGNRSIMADPSHPGVVDHINAMIKQRDFWMPFAPVILEERADDYISNPKRIPAPHMMMAFDTTDRSPEMIAATHRSDRTARPQVIAQETNPFYYRILKEFESITGRGVLLNTSFNLHGYPIVYGPREALWVFENSGLSHLCLGDYLVSKRA